MNFIYRKQAYTSSYIPLSFQYPDLGMILEIESPVSSPPPQNQWLYWIGALATLGLMSFSFLVGIPSLKQASQEIQQATYTDYLSLIDHLR